MFEGAKAGKYENVRVTEYDGREYLIEYVC